METKNCPYCAESIATEAVYCKHCKSDLVKQEKKPSTFNKTGTMIFVGILLFIAGCTALVSGDDYSSSSYSTSTTEPTACSIHAYVAGAVIEGYTKYPDEARKPSCTEASLVKNSDGTYTMTGYVIAPNAFGTEGRVYYSVDLRFKGGNTTSLDNWEVVSEPVITQ